MLSVIIIFFLMTTTGLAVCFLLAKRRSNPGKKLSDPSMRILTEWDLRCMAFHESGHAVCSCYLPERELLVKITINPSEESFGMISTERRPHHNETETSLRSRISTLLAGSLAEELFLNTRTTGGIHDFADARSIAVDMVTKFGMGRRLGKVAPVSVYDNSYRLFSEEYRRRADEDAIEIIREAELASRNVLVSHSSLVVDLAELLLEKQTLNKDEIISFFHSKDRSKR